MGDDDEDDDEHEDEEIEELKMQMRRLGRHPNDLLTHCRTDYCRTGY